MKANRQPTHGGEGNNKRPTGALGDEIDHAVQGRRGANATPASEVSFYKASPAAIREWEISRRSIEIARREWQVRSAGIVRGFAAETAQVLAQYNVRPTHELRVKDGTEKVEKRKPGLLGLFGATVTETVDKFRYVEAWQLSMSEKTTATSPMPGQYGVQKWTTTTARTGQALGQDGELYTFSRSSSDDRYAEFAVESQLLTPAGIEGRNLGDAQPATDEELIPLNTLSLNAAAEDQSAVRTWRQQLLAFATNLIK